MSILLIVSIAIAGFVVGNAIFWNSFALAKYIYIKSDNPKIYQPAAKYAKFGSKIAEVLSDRVYPTW